MSPRLLQFFASMGVLIVLAFAFSFIFSHSLSATPAQQETPATIVSTSTQTAAVAAIATSTKIAVATPTTAVVHTTTAKTTLQPAQKTQSAPTATTTVNEATRLQNAYSTPPESFDTINAAVRAALVNILCMPRSGGSLQSISGSGVIIDPRGVILTNAHVAQYVLLSEDPDIDLSCVIRTGAPATAKYTAEVLYIPSVWVNAHASDINDEHPTGTGEHDYALLLINGSADTSPLPATFPYLQADSREGVAFEGDQVLVASYPAEFLGGLGAQYSLYPDSSVTTIDQLITFDTDTIDLLSLGGIIEAQSGSSGGAVVNAWGRLVGLIVTTSEGTTTAQRDLRGLSLSYIDRDIAAQTSTHLASILSGDVATEAATFTAQELQSLVTLYLPYLGSNN